MSAWTVILCCWASVIIWKSVSCNCVDTNILQRRHWALKPLDLLGRKIGVWIYPQPRTSKSGVVLEAVNVCNRRTRTRFLSQCFVWDSKHQIKGTAPLHQRTPHTLCAFITLASSNTRISQLSAHEPISSIQDFPENQSKYSQPKLRHRRKHPIGALKPAYSSRHAVTSPFLEFLRVELRKGQDTIPGSVLNINWHHWSTGPVVCVVGGGGTKWLRRYSWSITRRRLKLVRFRGSIL